MKTKEFIPSPNHWNQSSDTRLYPPYTERLTLQEARYVLLKQNDPIIRGHLYKWKVKHIGCGVYELSVNFGKK